MFRSLFISKTLGTACGSIILILISEYLNPWIGGNIFVFGLGYGIMYFTYFILPNLIWSAVALLIDRMIRKKGWRQSHIYAIYTCSTFLVLLMSIDAILDWDENMKIRDYIPYYFSSVELLIVLPVTLLTYRYVHKIIGEKPSL